MPSSRQVGRMEASIPRDISEYSICRSTMGWTFAARRRVSAPTSESLKAAAAQLDVDAATVTRRVAALEARLGVTLLRRSTRRTEPTEAGARYFQGMSRIAAEQDALEAEVAGSSDAPAGLLRVTAPVDFGARFVVPAVLALRQEAPSLRVELVLGSGALNLAEQGIDVAIRVGRVVDSALISRKLGTVPRVLVASQDYLARRGTPTHPDTLAEHDFVLYTAENATAPLELHGPNGEVLGVRPRGPCAVNSVTGIRALVLGGQGLTVGPLWAFEDLLRTGELVRVLPDWTWRAFPLHALYLPSPFVPAKIRAFVAHMARAAPLEPPADGPGQAP